jgi:hypothetical protein
MDDPFSEGNPMTFYVRRSKDSEIEGPFTIEQINQMIRQKRFTLKSLAVADKGQGLQSAQNTPAKQWTMLADIPGYEPDPAVEGNCLLIALAVLIVVAMLVIIGLVKLSDILHRIH